MADDAKENLLEAYKLLCGNYHAIDDFRAKLLGVLPIASGAGFIFLSDKLPALVTMKPIAVAGGVFGFLVTLGLFVFEIHGIRKCSDCFRLGRDMEAGLGITGQFSLMPRTKAPIIPNEPFAAGIIYPAVLAAWAFFALHFTRENLCPFVLNVVPVGIFLLGFAGMLRYDYRLRHQEYGADCQPTK